MSTREREKIGMVTALYAVIHMTINGWLRGLYGRATRSIASAIVCGMVALNVWTGLRALDEALAFSLIRDWRNASFIALIIVCAAVDLAFVETGKAEKWASTAMDRYGFLKDHRNALCITLIAVTLVPFAWSLIAA